MTKDKKVNLLTGAILAAALAMTAAFPASAKEERTPVGHITLNLMQMCRPGMWMLLCLFQWKTEAVL